MAPPKITSSDCLLDSPHFSNVHVKQKETRRVIKLRSFNWNARDRNCAGRDSSEDLRQLHEALVFRFEVFVLESRTDPP